MVNSTCKIILLVEDEAIIAIAQKRDLENFGYNVISVNSGEKAIETVNQTPEIDLILMDIDLGKGLDGSQTAVIILNYRDIPIVFLSSHTEPEVVAKTEKITSYGYVVKNSGITVLVASIKMAFKLFNANKQIAESEIKQKTMISNISDVIGIIDLDCIIKYISPNIEKWFGWQQQDMIGFYGWSFIHPDDMEYIKNEFSILLSESNMIKTEKFRYKCKDGSFKPIEFTAVNLTSDPIIKGVLYNFRDITERKLAEETQKLNEARLTALMKINQMELKSDDEFIHFVLENSVQLTKSNMGYIAYVNEDETTFTMYAWSNTAMELCQITNKPIVYKIEDTGLWGEAVRQRKPIITNDYSQANEFKRGLPEGHVEIIRHMNVPVFDGDHIVIVAGVANKGTDYDGSDVNQLTLLIKGAWKIIQTKKAEEALRQSREQLKIIVNNLQAVIFSVDSNGIFTFSDGKILANLDLNPGQVVGISVYEFYKDVPEVIEGIKNALSGKYWSGKTVVQGIVFETFINPVFDLNKKVIGATGFAIDKTEK